MPRMNANCRRALHPNCHPHPTAHEVESLAFADGYVLLARVFRQAEGIGLNRGFSEDSHVVDIAKSITQLNGNDLA